MSIRRPRLSLQHQLDHQHGFAPPECPCGIGERLVLAVDLDPVLEGWMRVATASGLLPAQRSLDKQETPGVSAPGASVPTERPIAEVPGGCCPDCAP
jgi:hypothetical protein